jgi:hypothetical protein
MNYIIYIGLTMTNIDVFKICQIAKHIIRKYSKKSYLSNDNYVLKLISLLNFIKYFINLTNHFMVQEPLNNHLLQLIRLIIKKYIKIRIHHINTGANKIDKRVRKFYTKLIHFQYQ